MKTMVPEQLTDTWIPTQSNTFKFTKGGLFNILREIALLFYKE